MFTQQTVIKQLKKIAAEIRGTGIHLHKVILYGSYSRNEQQNWSDIDVVLVADEFNAIGFEDVHLLAEVLRNYDEMNLQPQTYNTNDFSEELDPFVGEILRTGIETLLFTFCSRFTYKNRNSPSVLRWGCFY